MDIGLRRCGHQRDQGYQRPESQEGVSINQIVRGSRYA
ncbi:hypothetical protein [Enterobacter phage 02_vB_Eclo_IJM]|nr:hypothetical protein [Enterobacter phage 02_vB_Eclo_IJM]